MAFSQRVEFGNFTLKFGEQKVLLDLFHEIVKPSFDGRRYVRGSKERGEHFFLDTELVVLKRDDGREVAALAGRIVKNTKLKREQIYASGEIVADKKELETAPTSIFVLLLENHRLIFCREVSGAPTIKTFESTCRSFLIKRHAAFIEELMAEKKVVLGGDPPRGTKAAFLRENPYPDLRITPLTDKQSLEEFINRFRLVEELVVKLLPTNKEEIDNDDFWRDLGRRKDDMNSTLATVKFTNAKDGLVADEVISQTTAATGLGNSSVSVRGYDMDGDHLKGNNDDFSLTVEVGDLPSKIPSAAVVMHNTFKKLTESGVIALPALAAGVIDRVRALVPGLH